MRPHERRAHHRCIRLRQSAAENERCRANPGRQCFRCRQRSDHIQVRIFRQQSDEADDRDIGSVCDAGFKPTGLRRSWRSDLGHRDVDGSV